MRVRRGLYYKGAQTVVGMTTPTPYAIGLHIAGSGSGLAGFAAAAMLGLTTQVPSVLEMAVPRSGQLPVAPPGVAFVKRDVLRSKLDLNPFEIAVIEVACDWPKTVEEDWDTFEELVKNLVISGALRAVAMVGWGAIRYGGVLDDLWRARWDQLRPLAPTGTVALMPWSTMTR